MVLFARYNYFAICDQKRSLLTLIAYFILYYLSVVQCFVYSFFFLIFLNFLELL